jgi:hypothetical protein
VLITGGGHVEDLLLLLTLAAAPVLGLLVSELNGLWRIKWIADSLERSERTGAETSED